MITGKFNILLAYLGCLSFTKIWNYILLNLSFKISKILKKPVRWGTPFAISVETVAGCNLRCPGCETGSGQMERNQGIMNYDDFSIILRKLPSQVFHINLHFQGEPLLHPHIADFVLLARRKHLFVSFSTNGTLLSEEIAKQLIQAGLCHIIISLDGYDEKSYTHYRKGGDYTTVLQNLRTLAEMKISVKRKYPVIEVQALVLKSNEHHLKEMKKIALNKGANIFTMKSAYVPDINHIPEYLPENPKFLRYIKTSEGKLILKKTPPRFCFRLHGSMVVTHDLSVAPCCFDKNGKHILGNLLTEEFQSIRNGSAMMNFCKNLAEGKAPAMCSNCI